MKRVKLRRRVLGIHHEAGVLELPRPWLSPTVRLMEEVWDPWQDACLMVDPDFDPAESRWR